MSMKVRYIVEREVPIERLLQKTPTTIPSLCQELWKDEDRHNLQVKMNGRDITGSTETLINLVKNCDEGVSTLDILETKDSSSNFNLGFKHVLKPFDDRSEFQLNVPWSISVADIKHQIWLHRGIPVEYICLFRPQGAELSSIETLGNVIASTHEILSYETRYPRDINISCQQAGSPAVRYFATTTRTQVKDLAECIAASLKWPAEETILFHENTRLEAEDCLDFFNIDNGSRVEARSTLSPEHKLHKFFGPKWSDVAEVRDGSIRRKVTTAATKAQDSSTPCTKDMTSDKIPPPPTTPPPERLPIPPPPSSAAKTADPRRKAQSALSTGNAPTRGRQQDLGPIPRQDDSCYRRSRSPTDTRQEPRRRDR